MLLEGYTSSYPRPRFWDSLAQGRFELLRCVLCDEWQAPGAVRCGRCGSGRIEWRSASGRGSVYSLLERLPSAGARTSFILVVALDEGPTVMGCLEGASARAEVGMRVEVVAPSSPSSDGLPFFAESVI